MTYSGAECVSDATARLRQLQMVYYTILYVNPVSQVRLVCCERKSHHPNEMVVFVLCLTQNNSLSLEYLVLVAFVFCFFSLKPSDIICMLTEPSHMVAQDIYCIISCTMCLQAIVTVETASMLIEDITSVLDTSNEEDQTTENINIVTNVLKDVVGLLGNSNFTVDKNVRE